MPTPMKLMLDLAAEASIDFEGLLPLTPGRPPSPRADEEMPKQEMFTIPEPPPPRESTSCPASFARKYRTSAPPTRPSSARARTLRDQVLPSRNGSPAWRGKPTSAFGMLTSARDQLRLYNGKEEPTQFGQYGPGFYEAKVSRTGAPALGCSRNAPSFAARFDQASLKLYRGKENMTPGQYGPGMYDVRVFKTGSPRGGAKGTPRWASGQRFDRERCYEGREAVHLLKGKSGPTATNNAPMCSNRGSPLWKNRPSAAFALPHAPKLRRMAA